MLVHRRMTPKVNTEVYYQNLQNMRANCSGLLSKTRLSCSGMNGSPLFFLFLFCGTLSSVCSMVNVYTLSPMFKLL